MMATWAPETRRTDGITSGVYTRTIVRSPVVRWILHAQIRHAAYNDTVFVGEDYVEVKEVGPSGHLQHIATKCDFDARITATAVFDTNDDDAEAGFLARIKHEPTQDGDSAGHCPPQFIVLALDSHNLVFLAMVSGTDGTPRFIQSIVPLPTFDRTLYQLGQHIAVDSRSRAVAVAAMEHQVVLYGTKSKDQLKYELKVQPSEFCPISSSRPLKIDGVIQHMDFLTPPATSSDQVILLLIIISQGRTKAIRIEWHSSTGPRRAQVHSAQVLQESENVPSLLIPLRDASFLVIEDDNITLWKDILSGSATDSSWVMAQDEPRHPGLSARSPAWVNWAKPRRSKAASREKDVMYLVREDGHVVWVEATLGPRPTLTMSRAGDLDCHVGTAFASVGDEDGPDILAIAGETSTGRTVSIGLFFTPRLIEEMSREEAMKFDTIQTLPNWASVTDMVSSKELHANRHQAAYTDTVLVTSGRQPYGAVTEIRRGLEGRLALSVPLDILKSVTNVFTVPDRSMGSVNLVLILSSPDETRLFQIDGDFEDIAEIHNSTAFDLSMSTLAAGVIASGHLVQVTNQGFCVTVSIQGNFEDTVRKNCEGDSTILAAQLVPDDNSLVVVEDSDTGCSIFVYGLTSPPDFEPQIHLLASSRLTSKALCVAAVKIEEGVLVALSTVNGTIETMLFAGPDSIPAVSTTTLPASSTQNGTSSICDNIVILQDSPDDTGSSALSIACGLRDGRIMTFQMDLTAEDRKLVQDKEVPFRKSTVKLVPLSNNKSAAYALSETDLCLLSWDGRSTSIDSVWIADKGQPDMAQPPIMACAQTPQSMWLSSPVVAELLVAVSEDELFFAAVLAESTIVPRQIPVEGTPSRLLHAESLQSIVCSSLFAGVRKFPSSTPHKEPEERRQIWPVINFIPSGKNGGAKYAHHMQPGDRVNALLEWSYTNSETKKTYPFIVVGTKHIGRSGAQGRVTFLRPRFQNRRWEVSDVVEVYKLTFPEEVTALTQLNNNTIVVVANESVYHYTYREATNEWESVRLPGSRTNVTLGSPGVYATIDTPGSHDDQDPDIVVSTARDSLVVLKGSTRETVAMGPHAQNLLSHQLLSPSTSNNMNSALVTTKTGSISRLSWQLNAPAAQPARLDYTIDLRRSLTRLIESEPPARKHPPPEGLQGPRIVGCATDGALVAIQEIDMQFRDRLSWLQRLIEWSPILSPHSHQNPTYDRKSDEGGMTFPERHLPIGLSKRDTIPLQARNFVENDLHVDGDVLARVLGRGGVEEVGRVMRILAGEEGSAVGRWMGENLEGEVEALPDIVSVVRELEGWIG